MDDKPKSTINSAKALDRIAPGGVDGPIDNRLVYEEQIKDLPAEQRDFLLEEIRFADLWKYVTEQGMRLPADVVLGVHDLPKIPLPLRTTRMREINEKLMEFVHSVDENSGLRQ